MRILNHLLRRRESWDECEQRQRRLYSGTTEVEDEDGNVSLRRSTPEEIEYCRRIAEYVEGDMSGPAPLKPWTEPAAAARSSLIEVWDSAPAGPPPLPDPYPLSGYACYGCPPQGTADRRCCQFQNTEFIQSMRARLQ